MVQSSSTKVFTLAGSFEPRDALRAFVIVWPVWPKKNLFMKVHDRIEHMKLWRAQFEGALNPVRSVWPNFS